MTNMSKIMMGASGLAAIIAIAAPAAAQQPYPYGYPQQNGGVVGAIINSVTGGYGQYPMGNYGYAQVNERQAVSMCAAAAEQRISGTYRGQPGYGYANGYPNNGYQQGYANGYNGQRGYNASQSADLRFTCRVNNRGQVSDVNISRNQVAYRGY